MDLYESEATRFKIDREAKTLRPPFTACPGLGESAAQSIVEARKTKQFISVEELNASCPKLSKAHIDLLRHMGALDGMPDTSQITFFGPMTSACGNTTAILADSSLTGAFFCVSGLAN